MERETRATGGRRLPEKREKNSACSAGYYEVSVSTTLSFSERVMKFIAILSYGFVVEVASKNHLTVCFLRKRVAT